MAKFSRVKPVALRRYAEICGTVAECSKELCVEYSTLANWLRAESCPPHIEKLCEKLIELDVLNSASSDPNVYVVCVDDGVKVFRSLASSLGWRVTTLYGEVAE